MSFPAKTLMQLFFIVFYLLALFEFIGIIVIITIYLLIVISMMWRMGTIMGCWQSIETDIDVTSVGTQNSNDEERVVRDRDLLLPGSAHVVPLDLG